MAVVHERINSPVRKEGVEIVRYLIAGAIGGVMSWVYATVTSPNLPTGVSSELSLAAPPAWQLIFYPPLGAFAAVIAIYLLAKTDTKHVAHSLVFAAVCGFLWKPIIDSAQTYLAKTLELQKDAIVLEKAQKAEQTTDPVQKAAQVVQTLQQVGDVTNKDIKSEISKRLEVATESISKAPAADVKAKTNALESIAATAQETSHDRVAKEAVSGLKAIASNPNDAKSVAIAANSLDTVAGKLQTKNPEVAQEARSGFVEVVKNAAVANKSDSNALSQLPIEKAIIVAKDLAVKTNDKQAAAAYDSASKKLQQTLPNG